MKYYVYISDTKVNMLCDQIPSQLRDKLATELKIDLKFLSTTLSQEPLERTRYAKLQLVIDFIRRNYKIGTVDNPEFFFQGEMKLRWGSLISYATEIVFFGGMTKQTILGMAGSMKHVIGEVGASKPELPPRSGSEPPRILETLRDNLRKPSKPNYWSGNPGLPVLDEGLYDIAYAARTIKGPEQRLEFLAKRLLEGDEPTKRRDLFGGTGKRVLLGSPIYVALAE
jgi:hypothetical protein